MNKNDILFGIAILLSIIVTMGTYGIMLYEWGYDTAMTEKAQAHVLEVQTLEVMISELKTDISELNSSNLELNITKTEYYRIINIKQKKIDELIQILADLGYFSEVSVYDYGYEKGYNDGYTKGIEDSR